MWSILCIYVIIYIYAYIYITYCTVGALDQKKKNLQIVSVIKILWRYFSLNTLKNLDVIFCLKYDNI